MKNLAGEILCDVDIVNELLVAGIGIVPHRTLTGEVKSHFHGEVYGWEFRRAWRYWVARPMYSRGLPLDLAKKLHTTHGRTARVDGHCMAPPPENHLDYYDKEGRHLAVDPDGSHEAVFDRHKLPKGNYRFIKSLDEAPEAKGYVRLYHIDAQDALNQFVKIIKEQHEQARGV